MTTIAEKTGQCVSVTEFSRALRLFTNRHTAIRHFASLLNDDTAPLTPTPETIHFFHGDGGNGKSLLLNFLQERCCKRFARENWDYIKTLENEDFVFNVTDAEDAKEIPFASIDFQPSPALEHGSLQDSPTALLSLRRDLSAYGFRFPLFDFACIWYLHKVRKLSGNQLKKFFPAQDLVAKVIDALTANPTASLVKAVIGLKTEKLNTLYTVFSHRFSLDKEQLAAVERLDVKRELLDKLPELFADDLNAAMKTPGAPERVVLFFDSHEAFWFESHDLSSDRFFNRDRWLRVLLSALQLENGIVVVVAGREPPKWSKASRCHIPEEYLKLCEVGNLTEPDAAKYLERAGVVDQSMRQTLIRYSSVTTNEIHPLYLGLCVDILEAARNRGKSVNAADFAQMEWLKRKEQQLLESLLRNAAPNMAYAIRALGAARTFNFDLYLRLGQELKFEANTPSFETLIDMSFVRKDGPGNSYRIHNLVRRLAQDKEDELVQRAHTVLETYFRELDHKGDEFAIAQAIYHANRLDWERGVNEWDLIFWRAFRLSRYRLCSALIDVRREMLISSDYQVGVVSLAEALYLLELSRYEDARQKYLESIAAFEKTLTRAPHNLEATTNKGIALENLGALQTEVSEYQAASKSYHKAIKAYDKALVIAADTPHMPAIYCFRGDALQHLGHLQTELSQHKTARTSYRKAIAAYDMALALESVSAKAYNHKGLVLQDLGELQLVLAQYQPAMTSYREAIAAFDTALSLEPDSVQSLHSKGGALRLLGDLQAKLSQVEEAMTSYREGIAACEKALMHAPDDLDIHNARAIALMSLGETQAATLHCYKADYSEDAPTPAEVFDSTCQAAMASYHEAIAGHQRVLSLAPDHVPANIGKGNSLIRLGELQVEMSQVRAAKSSYQEAIAVYDRVLLLAPEKIATRHCKVIALQVLGDLEAKASKHQAARTSFLAALGACERALTLAPRDLAGHNDKGSTLHRLAALHKSMSQPEIAETNYKLAIDAYESGLKLAPSDAIMQKNKALALEGLGQLYEARLDEDAAIASYEAAIEAYEKALILTPGDLGTRGRMVLLQRQLKELRWWDLPYA